jgi:hypothetical protein
MTSLAALIQALASILWPIGIFGGLFLFRAELKHIIRRTKKWEGFGQKVELTETLDRLELEVAGVARSTVEVRPERPATEADDASISAIIAEASKSPKLALINLGSLLEKQARQILESAGWHEGRLNLTLSEAMQKLVTLGVLPPSIPGSLNLFSDVRSKLVHGSPTEEEMLRAIDSGLTLLRALYAIPLEKNVVYHPGVDVFSDPSCTKLITNAKGIVLETTSPGGATKSFRIFPTTRTHFRKGQRVAWEWNHDLRVQWGPAWYRDPDTHTIKDAWGGSLEFIGRDLDA